MRAWCARTPIRRAPRVVWLILALALALRVLVVALTWHTPTTLDPYDFSRTAASIAQGHGYPQSNRAPGGGPSAFRPPGYPVVLAGVYFLVGHASPAIGRLAGALLGTVSVALIGLIALRLWGKRVALLALGLAAVAPPLVILSTALVSEALFVPLVLGAVAAALAGRGSEHGRRWAALAGLLVGLASLTRTNGVILLVPLLLAFAPSRGRRRRLPAWGPSAVVLVAALLTIVPWTIRNWVVFHSFVPVSDETGYTLAGTYNRVSRADRKLPAVWIEAEHGASPEYARILRTATARHWNEVTYGNHLLNQAITEIENDPGYVLKVGYWNTIRMFDIGQAQYARDNLHDTGVPLVPALLIINSSPVLVVLALGGLLTQAARRAPWWLWLVPLCLWATVFVTSFIRFRAPIDPFLVMLAALAIAVLLDDVARIRLRLAEGTRASRSAPGPTPRDRSGPGTTASR